MSNDLSIKKSLVSGGLAGLSSSIILQPFDLLKTRLQQQQQINADYSTSLTKEIRKLKNFKDLWRGVLPSALRTTTGSGIYLTLLSKTRIYLSSFKQRKQQLDPFSSTTINSSVLPKLTPMENLSVGFFIRAVAGIITMPITIVKTRYESNLYSYNSMYEGIEHIYMNGDSKGRGSLRNFFRGSLATLARDCPYAGLYVLFYESFKVDLSKVTHRFDLDNQPNMGGVINSSAAVLAASVATTVTAPFDLIKTRLQLASANSPSSAYIITKRVVTAPGGVKNLFKGLSLRLSRKGLSAGISWGIYEELLKRIM